MNDAQRNELITELRAITQGHINWLNGELAAVYLSRWPFAVVLEDCSMCIASDAARTYFRLTTDPAACQRFTREQAEETASQWNADPSRPHVVAMGHHEFFQKMRAGLQEMLDSLPAN